MSCSGLQVQMASRFLEGIILGCHLELLQYRAFKICAGPHKIQHFAFVLVLDAYIGLMSKDEVQNPYKT